MLCAHISCGVKWAWRSSSHLNWGVFSWRGRGRTMEEDELAAVGWERGRIGGRQADSVSVNRIVFLHLRLGARWQLIISEKLHLHFQLNFNTNSASSVHHHSAWAAPYRHWHIVGPSVLVTALEKWEHLCKRASGWLIGLWEILVLHSGTAGTRACLIFFHIRKIYPYPWNQTKMGAAVNLWNQSSKDTTKESLSVSWVSLSSFYCCFVCFRHVSRIEQVDMGESLAGESTSQFSLIFTFAEKKWTSQQWLDLELKFLLNHETETRNACGSDEGLRLI